MSQKEREYLVSMRTSKRHRHDVHYLMFVFVLSYFIYFWFISRVFPSSTRYNSDMLFYMMAGEDLIKNGNIFLQSWHGGATNTFYLLILLYGFVGRFTGYHYQLIWLVSSFLFSLFVLTVNLVVLRHSFREGKERYIFGLLITSLLLFSAYTKDNGINAGIHIDAAIILIWFFHIISKADGFSLRDKRVLTALIMLLIGGISDGLVILIAVMSLGMVFLCHLIYKSDQTKKIFLWLISSLFIATACKIILLVWSAYFMQNKVVGYVTSSDRIVQTIVYGIESVLNLFGVNPFGMAVNIWMFPILFISGVLSVLAGIMIVQRKKICMSLLSQFSIAGACSVLLLIITLDHSTKLEVEMSSRLSHMVLFGFVFLISKIDEDSVAEYFSINKKWMNYTLIAAACMITLFSAIRIHNIPNTKQTKYNAIINKIKELDLKKGFASYTNSFAMEIEAGGDVAFTTLYGYPTMVFTMLNKEPKETDYINYVVLDDSETWVPLTREYIVRTFGEPDKVYDFENLHLMVWDENLLPYVNRLKDDVMIYNSGRFNYSAEVSREGELVFLGKDVIQYGPYVRVKKGRYKITYMGEGMDNFTPHIESNYADEKGISNSYQVIEQNHGSIVMELEVHEDTENMEFRIINSAGGKAGFERLVMERIVK